MPRRLVFLPGMSGEGELWAPVAARFADDDVTLVDYPGLGASPATPAVASYEDLVRMIVDTLDGPAALIAQSMGGYVAIQAAARAGSG